jgi:hypothetical protein
MNPKYIKGEKILELIDNTLDQGNFEVSASNGTNHLKSNIHIYIFKTDCRGIGAVLEFIER